MACSEITYSFSYIYNFLLDNLWYQEDLCMWVDWWKSQSEDSLQDCQDWQG